MNSLQAYDWNTEMRMALVSDPDFNDIQYVDLDVAPPAAPENALGFHLLPLLHSLAYARLMGGFIPKGDYVRANQWLRYSQMRADPALPKPAPVTREPEPIVL